MPLVLSDILPEEAVLPDLQATTQHEVLRELLAPLVSLNPDVLSFDLVDELEQREKLGTTAVGNGVAIPHSKVSGLSSIALAVGRSAKGIAFSPQEQELSQIFFLILAPEQGAGQHLRLLSQIARLAKDPLFRAGFMQASDRAELRQIIVTP